MWTVGDDHEASEETKDLSKGLGLALLSKALGVEKIEDKYSEFKNRIKKTNLVGKLELRRKLQRKIRDDLIRLNHKSDFYVSKMYWKSKKSVYGIDNELHLVEQVQKCMQAIFEGQIQEKKRITHQEIKEIFDNEFEKSDESSDEENQQHKAANPDSP